MKQLPGISEAIKIRILNFIQNKNKLAAYLLNLYFLDIIYFLSLSIYLYSRIISSITAVITALILAILIIKIYNNSRKFKKISLFIIDLHSAALICYIFTAIILRPHSGILSLVYLIYRILCLFIDAALILILSSNSNISISPRTVR
jgi:hypothetical protein